MGEYLDFGVNLQSLLDLWYGGEEVKGEDTEISETETSFESDSQDSTKRYRSTSSVELLQKIGTPIEARKAICVTGLDRENIQYVKNTLASLSTDPIPLESFHIKQASDVIAGSLLVPKVVVVATHIPGKLLIDEDGDMGQIDFLYDELVEIGADMLLIYTGLPKSVYPPMRHMIYHPRMIDLVFPNQPILRHLANENNLITTVGNTDFTNMQKNVMKEWLSKPVNSDHPVFKHASSYKPHYEDESSFWSETEVFNRNWYSKNASSEPEESFRPAKEEHPLVDGAKRKKKSKLIKIKKKRGYKRYERLEEFEAGQFNDDLQMDMYGHHGYTAESFTQMSV